MGGKIEAIQIVWIAFYCFMIENWNILWYDNIMRMQKSIGALIKSASLDEEYINLSPEERISFMWELTSEIWSLQKEAHAERRLQRNIANLIRIPSISKANLIKNKKYTNREKDKLDAKYLESN